jgi:hypothetical protein
LRTVFRAVKAACFVVADALFAPLTMAAAYWFFHVRKYGIKKMTISHRIFDRIGVFPVRDHYYEPLFRTSELKKSLRNERVLPGIKLNVSGQLALLREFHYSDELGQFPLDGANAGARRFYFHNGTFESGDAEYYYNIIRLLKPKKIVEVGCGNSTLMALEAVKKNQQEQKGYKCDYVCIEPYENAWLEDLGVRVVRKRVEDVEKELFTSLGHNSILFIDSSHIIRPQGDVLFEYLEILPILNSGVLVHIHDIFTPRDYLDEWVLREIRFWNEQYLLEAFLSFNDQYIIVGALNFLRHHHASELAEKCPVLGMELDSREPGSFWLRRL